MKNFLVASVFAFVLIAISWADDEIELQGKTEIGEDGQVIHYCEYVRDGVTHRLTDKPMYLPIPVPSEYAEYADYWEEWCVVCSKCRQEEGSEEYFASCYTREGSCGFAKALESDYQRGYEY